MKMDPFFHSKARVILTGSAPEECLNLFVAEALPFWDIHRTPAGELQITISYRDLARAEKLSLQAYCDVKLLSHWGLPKLLSKTLKRPVFILGLFIALFLSFFLQRYIWSVSVVGEDPAMDRQITRLLQESGIRFGSSAVNLDSQAIKLNMLQKVPELSWLAVNRRGGKLTIMYLLRPREDETEQISPNHLVSSRDAVITEFTVLEGMRMIQLGDTVRKGQLLVSGFEDYGLILKGVKAEGEIYGETWHSGSVAFPSVRSQKCYTGREWTEYILIVGRKRINLFGNSGIYHATCDKIIDEKILRLPNVDFTVRLQVVTFREYTLQKEELSSDDARMSMERSWQKTLQEQMVAGTVNHTQSAFLQMEGYYILYARSFCREMIAVPVPVEDVYKGDNYD